MGYRVSPIGLISCNLYQQVDVAARTASWLQRAHCAVLNMSRSTSRPENSQLLAEWSLPAAMCGIEGIERSMSEGWLTVLTASMHKKVLQEG